MREFGIDILVHSVRREEDEYGGNVIVKVEVTVKDNDKTCDVSLEMEGCFVCSSDIQEGKFVSMLHINGGSILYTIARAEILKLSASVFSTKR